MRRPRKTPHGALPTTRPPQWKPSGIYGPTRLLELSRERCQHPGCEDFAFEGPHCIEHAYVVTPNERRSAD